MMTSPVSFLASLGLLVATGCQPPVVEAHIEPKHQHCAEGVADGPDTPSGNLTVTGTATLKVTPDIADVTLELTAAATSPRAAVAKLRTREEAMRKNLAEEGMAAEDIAVSTLNLHPTSRWDVPRQRQIPTGYEARLHVTVATKDFSQIPAVVEAGANAGVTTSSTTFRNTEMTQLKRRVRDMALDAAKAKAKQFQGSLELDVMRVVSVSEVPSGMAWSAYSPGFDNAVFTANIANVAGAASGPVQAQTLPLQLTVTVGYALG